MVFQMYHSDWKLSHDHIWTLRPFSRNRKKVIFDRMADIVLGGHTELRLEKNIRKHNVYLWPGKNTLFQLIGCIYGLEKSHFCRQRGAFINDRENHICVSKVVHLWLRKIILLSPKRCIHGREKPHLCR